MRKVTVTYTLTSSQEKKLNYFEEFYGLLNEDTNEKA